MKQFQSRFATMYRYITIYHDFTLYNDVCELVHFSTSLPDAIKSGRSYVRDLNHDFRRNNPGLPKYRRYVYGYTYRAR